MFNYFGSKQRLAKTYQPPRHDIIVEPFAGAAAYAVAWLVERPTLRAVLFDKDEKVVGLWHRLLQLSPQEIMDIPTPEAGSFTDDLLVALASSSATTLGAFHITGHVKVSEWIARDWPSVRRRIARNRALIGEDRIEVRHGNYTECPRIEATWFVDPPYQHQGHRYHYGSEGINYQHLGDWCRSLPGQVIVTEAAPADWLPFTPHRMVRDQTRGSNTELVWYSEPEPTLFDMGSE